MYSEILLSKIRRAAEGLPPSLINDFASAPGEHVDGFWDRFILACPSSVQRNLLTDLVTTWKAHGTLLTESELFQMLLAMSYGIHNVPTRYRPEIVWTGPTGKAPVRQTRQVLKELFSSAIEDIFIVSYVVFDIPELSQVLAEALSRKVSLTFYFEDAEESGGKIFTNASHNLSHEIRSNSKTYVWRKEKRLLDGEGRAGSLHAKVAIVDRRKILLTSANLTKYALDLNIELGILFESQSFASEVISHFEELRRRKVFTQVD